MEFIAALKEEIVMSHKSGASHKSMEDQPLWVAIRNRTRALAFDRYAGYMREAIQERGADASAEYRSFKLLTETFLKNDDLLPIELIWSYWMEEGMLVQTMEAVSRRLQDMRGSGERDPLMEMEIDPLRPLNNLIWGYIQDEPNRLSVRRRAYEYSHQYGLALYGKAAAGAHPPETRSKFLEAFHNLLYQASLADDVPLLNAIQEVHPGLAQGAHNQFGDLPWTARVEMMLTQFILSQPEIHRFLGVSGMDAQHEPWEGAVDAMKTLQGWGDVSVSHFRDLAACGEQLLLSIRHGDWRAGTEHSARNWARYFRPEIQGYIHAYRAVTGIDLTSR